MYLVFFRYYFDLRPFKKLFLFPANRVAKKKIMREAAKTFFLEFFKKISMCLFKAQCHLRYRNLPCALVYRRLDAICGPEIAARTCLSKARCHLRPEDFRAHLFVGLRF